MPVPQALVIARSRGYDMVEVSPSVTPPVCRLIDFGKYRYDIEKKEKLARRRQKGGMVKEIKFRPKIDKHDYQIKLMHIEEFLKEGYKVRMTIMFRGREFDHVDIGTQMVNRAIEDLKNVAVVETEPKMDGRNLSVILVPGSGKKEKPADKKVNADAATPPVQPVQIENKIKDI